MGRQTAIEEYRKASREATQAVYEAQRSGGALRLLGVITALGLVGGLATEGDIRVAFFCVGGSGVLVSIIAFLRHQTLSEDAAHLSWWSRQWAKSTEPR